MEGAVFQDVVNTQEGGLVVLDYAGVGGDCVLAVRERIQGVDGLVRRHVVGQVDEDIDLVGGHILDFLDFDFALVLCLEYRGYDVLGVAAVRYLSDSYGVAVDFLDFGPHLYAAAPLSAHILAAVSIAAGGEVGINLVLPALEYGYRRVDELVEVVGENL